MTEVQTSEDQHITDLADELTHARRRGLERLDIDTKQYPYVHTPILEKLARKYKKDRKSARIALIKDLLRDALAAWEGQRHDVEAQFVRDLFFAEDGGAPGKLSPTDLRDAVKKVSGLNDDAFDERRRAMFQLFAEFLLRFVSANTRARRLRRLVAAAVATVVVGTTIWLAVKTSGGSPAVFTFDDLGGGSPIIQVYPGVTNKPEDKLANGSFEDGQMTTALCKTTGRMVHSVPAEGEVDTQSDIWVKVLGRPGVTHYATLVYGNMPPDVLASLPECSGR